jgi:pyridoxamine 5'-phosphate oxidase
MNDIRQYLRDLPTLSGPFQSFDIDTCAATPQEQFLRWLGDAIAAGVLEPHAMILSTCDAEGCPDARVLILKDLNEAGWSFALNRASPKGRHLTRLPRAALTFYWPKVGRQVRIRGPVAEVDRAISEADFEHRPLGSRAAALVARQSEVLSSPADLDAALSAQYARLEREPNLTLKSWTVLVLNPNAVEFWQGDTQRRHTRVRYFEEGNGWKKEALWP